MSETMSWSLSAGGPGGGVSASGSMPCDAITLASVTVDAAGSKALTLQLADLTKILFLSVSSSIYGDKVKVKAAGNGAVDIKLLGPLVLFGDAVKLLGPSLATLTVANAHTTKPVDIDIVIATKLA